MEIRWCTSTDRFFENRRDLQISCFLFSASDAFVEGVEIIVRQPVYNKTKERLLKNMDTWVIVSF